MPLSFSDTLQQERSRLSLAAASLAACVEHEAVLAELFSAVNELRQSITETLQRCTAGFTVGELIQLQVSLHTLLDEELRRILEKRFAQQKEMLTRLAERDPLTQLPNRAAFERRLHTEALRAHRYGREFSLVFFDIDDFKSVNDQFGHLVGDQVLAGLAAQFQSSLRQSDAVFRYGGDEFVALCPETSRQAMEAVLQRVESHLRDGWKVAEVTKNIGVSWGIASFPADTTDLKELLRLADRRLYDCKKSITNARGHARNSIL